MLKDYEVEQEGKTIFEIVGNEKIDLEAGGAEWLGLPYCHFITKLGEYGYFIKYDAPKEKWDARHNGYWDVLIEVDEQVEFAITDRVWPNRIIEL